MATTSFKKEFVVRDKDAAERLKSDMANNSPTISYSKKNTSSDRKKGEDLLARLVSA